MSISDRSGDTLSVEVVFALRERQELVTVLLEKGATVEDAIQRSGLHTLFPEFNLQECAVGIWGQAVNRDRRLEQGDRVELYRPLEIDPRKARRALAKQGRSMGQSPETGHSAETPRTGRNDGDP